jgi:hypothetical protein
LNKADLDTQKNEESNTESEQFNERTWRREKVWELKSKGYTHREIIEEISRKDPLVKISLGTVNNDLTRKQAEIRANFQRYIEQDLVAHHHLALTNLQAINKEAWKIFEKATDEKVKLSALHTAQEAQSAINATLGDPEFIAKAMKVAGRLRKQLDITTNATSNSNTGNSTEGENEELQEREATA